MSSNATLIFKVKTKYEVILSKLERFATNLWLNRPLLVGHPLMKAKLFFELKLSDF